MLGGKQQYYEPKTDSQKVMKFTLTENETISILQNLVKVNKKGELEYKNIRKDYGEMANELIQSLLPFHLPSKAEFEQLQEEMKILKTKMNEARKTQTTITPEEDQRNLALFKQKNTQVKELVKSFQTLQEFSSKLLEIIDGESITEQIENYTNDGITGTLDPVWILRDELNKWLKKAKELILQEFPLGFKNDLEKMFNQLSNEDKKRFQLLHAEHLVNLKRSEIKAILTPDNIHAQKEAQKAQVLYQIETSQLQYDIS